MVSFGVGKWYVLVGVFVVVDDCVVVVLILVCVCFWCIGWIGWGIGLGWRIEFGVFVVGIIFNDLWIGWMIGCIVIGIVF